MCWGAGVAAVLWFRTAQRNVQGDVGIDSLREQLLIPKAGSMDDCQTIPFKAVQRIEKLVIGGDSENPSKADLSLVYRSESGSEQSHRLGLWSTEATADRFTAWFERQVRLGESI
jgi:hypothetical protein